MLLKVVIHFIFNSNVVFLYLDIAQYIHPGFCHQALWFCFTLLQTVLFHYYKLCYDEL